MNKIVLKKETLSNFRQVNVEVNYNDGTTEISSRNGVGKSSLDAAWKWLLCGYTDTANPKNHELYDSTKELNENTPITRVKADVEVNGIAYTLEKTAEAKFVKKRGETTYEKASSDNYVYYIDSIKTSVGDFNAWIERNICPVDMLPYCLDGGFFANEAEEEPKKARKVLEGIVGEISDSELKGDYTELTTLMNEKGYSVEQVRTQQKEKLNSLKSDETRVRAEIELKEKSLAELQSIDYDVIEKQIAEIKKQIEDIDNTLLGKAEAIKPILGQRDAIFEIINSKTLKLNEGRNTYNNKFNALRNDINAQIREIRKDNALVEQRNKTAKELYDNNKGRLETQRTLIKKLNEERERLVKERDEVKSMTFTDTHCSFCGNELPSDMIEDKRNEFNKNRQAMLDNIVARGKNIKQQIEQHENVIAILEQSVEAQLVLEQPKSTQELENRLSELDKSYIPYENTEEYQKMFNEIETLKSTLPEIPQSDNEGLTNMKRSLITELETQNRMYGKKQDIIDTMNKIEALKSDLRNICNEEARIEGLLAKITEYVEEKANIVSSRVNDKLSICKIQMYRVQKDGGIAPDCRVYSKEGVPFSTINNSKAMLIRIDLQRFFCNHFNVQLPIFVDEYKSFDDFNAPKSQGEQMIMLYASNSPILEVK